MVPRRAQGALEAEVLAALWSAEAPLSPEDVRGRVSEDLAYTTVQTILVRLHDKGVLARTAHGRGYVYAPLVDEPGLTARRMRALLDADADDRSVLSRFVETLSPQQEAALRRALDQDRR